MCFSRFTATSTSRFRFSCSQLKNRKAEGIPGVSAKVGFKVPGSAGIAGLAPSIMGSVSESALVLRGRTLARGSAGVPVAAPPARVRAMAVCSWGKFARLWNTARLRMIVYTKLEFPVDYFSVTNCTKKRFNLKNMNRTCHF